ncbi:hypothetical protein AJ80_08288 [Polytolypa hystricis UAMH7299]|uniref:DNA2/NAM7 helicase helicase domain-containing protein n=1 Tax=Polytolypa hystricis (strain UAMH7299) TaxID=1447883 RepID=A0A2B7XAD7_POLH7|nr:hypothetical protein AJ80_08288 [Polytolypa hystricis UAMH7299]
MGAAARRFRVQQHTCSRPDSERASERANAAKPSYTKYRVSCASVRIVLELFMCLVRSSRLRWESLVELFFRIQMWLCTLLDDGCFKLYSAFEPVFILIDEAARRTEPAMWPILSCYNPHAYILFGDHQQLRSTAMSSCSVNDPRIEAKVLQNRLAPQLAKYLFARLIENGMKHVMFTGEHCMQRQIAHVVLGKHLSR